MAISAFYQLLTKGIAERRDAALERRIRNVCTIVDCYFNVTEVCAVQELSDSGSPLAAEDMLAGGGRCGKESRP